MYSLRTKFKRDHCVFHAASQVQAKRFHNVTIEGSTVLYLGQRLPSPVVRVLGTPKICHGCLTTEKVRLSVPTTSGRFGLKFCHIMFCLFCYLLCGHSLSHRQTAQFPSSDCSANGPAAKRLKRPTTTTAAAAIRYGLRRSELEIILLLNIDAVSHAETFPFVCFLRFFYLALILLQACRFPSVDSVDSVDSASPEGGTCYFSVKA